MRKFITVSLLVVSFCTYGQKSKGPIMHWRDYSANGDIYPASDYFPLDKEKMLCYLSNNDSNLFIDIIITDPGVQKTILNIGMNIWVDLTGKEVNSMGVRYPIGSDNVKASLQRKGEAMTNTEKMMFVKNSSIEMAFEIEVAGFGEEIPRKIPSTGWSGFLSNVHYNDDGNLIYRMVIPMKSVVVQEVKGKPVTFSIGLEYGATMLARPQASPSGGGTAGSPPGGRGGMGGGAPGASMQQVVDPVWIKGLLPAKK
jgi:hypothetical protein